MSDPDPAATQPGPEMYQAGTGAVRSSDLKEERWDLLSGAALRHLRDAMPMIVPDGETPRDLAAEAADYMWRFLGHDLNASGCRDRFTLLTKGWAWLAAAMEAEEGVPFVKVARYPLVALRRTAMASKEGEVKYGEENWLNGFRLKVLCNHALRHLVRYDNGVIEDDELGHASWGFMASVHMVLYRPDMCDLLAGRDYTITDELRAYHEKHLSRRRVAAADPSPGETIEVSLDGETHRVPRSWYVPGLAMGTVKAPELKFPLNVALPVLDRYGPQEYHP
jgi:hypothetical protein